MLCEEHNIACQRETAARTLSDQAVLDSMDVQVRLEMKARRPDCIVSFCCQQQSLIMQSEDSKSDC